MYVRAGRPAFARPCVGVHKSTSLMSSPLLLQQCPACLVRLTWIVFVIGGRWPNSWYLVGYCRQDLFKIESSLIRQLGPLAMRFSINTRSKTMNQMSAHRLPRYYQLPQVLTTAWTASFRWFTHWKVARIILLRNLWCTLLYIFILVWWSYKRETDGYNAPLNLW